jgi:hypothetical protein
MMAIRKPSSGVILLAIVGMVVIAVLLAPATSDIGGSYSTLSGGPQGTRLIYDLSRRLGWPSQRRDVPFDKEASHAHVQAVIMVSLGAHETHQLLEHVRRGGALLFAGAEGGLADSLHIGAASMGMRVHESPGECPNADAFENIIQGSRPIAPIKYTRPPPRDTVGFGSLETRLVHLQRAAVGFSLGKGKVVVVADPDFISNDVVRLCATQTDVAYVRMLEFLSAGIGKAPIAFDEFHHGSGIHGGSLGAVREYMVTAPSGRMLAQIAVAGLLLLFAVAPRPLSPRDPLRVARRSPFEHADALAHAYAAVGATRTATARLLDGVRRRARRRNTARESDEQLLAVASAATPAARTAAAVVSRALADTIPARELAGVAAAISTIEDALTSRSPTRKS